MKTNSSGLLLPFAATLLLAFPVGPAAAEDEEQPAAEQPAEEPTPGGELGDASDLGELGDDDAIFDLLEEEAVVVSGTRTAKKISESPSTITVITAKDIERSGAHSVAELFRSVPGMYVAYVSASDPNVSVRGFLTTAHPSVLLLIDGRYASFELFGNVLWNMLNIGLEDIERIEIIRGPGSALYGQGALNGVVQIFTKDPAKLAEQSVSGRQSQIGVTLGNEAIQRYSVQSGGLIPGLEGGLYRASAAYDRVGIFGDDEAPWKEMTGKPDEAQVMRGSLLYRQALPEDLELTLTGGVSKGYGQAQTGLGQLLYDDAEQYYAQAVLAHAHEIADTRITFDLSSISADVNFGVPYLPAILTLWNPTALPFPMGNLLASQGITGPTTAFIDTDGDGFYDTNNPLASPDVVRNGGARHPLKSNAYNLEALTSFKFEAGGIHNLTLGVNYRFTEGNAGPYFADQTIIEHADGTFETELSNQYRHSHIVSAFLQEDYAPLDWLSVFAGLRADYNTMVQGESFQVSPRGGLVFKFGDHALRASVGYAFRNPSMMELFYHIPFASPGIAWYGLNRATGVEQMNFIPAGTPADAYGACSNDADCSPEVPLYTPLGDHALKPEKMLQVEAGYQARLLGRLQIGLNFFYSDYDDRLDYDNLTQRFVNVDDTKILGGDVELAVEITRHLRGWVNYATLRYLNKKTPSDTYPPYTKDDDIENNPTLDNWGATPEHTLSAGLSFTWEGFQADLLYHFRDKVYWDLAAPIAFTLDPVRPNPLNPNPARGNTEQGVDLLQPGNTHTQLDYQHLVNVRLAYAFLEGKVVAAFAILNLLGEETSPDYPAHLEGNILGVFDDNGEFHHNPMGQPIPRRYLGTLTLKF